jgi:hypothetical protein
MTNDEIVLIGFLNNLIGDSKEENPYCSGCNGCG